MRRIIVILTLLLSATVAAVAQTHYEGRFWVGGRIGASISRTFFNPSVPQGMLPGAEVGATFRYAEEKHFGIVAELNYRQSGWKETFQNHNEFSFSHALHYLQIPVMTHIYFGSEKARFFFNAGPSISVMVGDNVHSNFDYKDIGAVPNFPTHNRNYNQYKLSKTNKFDYGISAGLGGEYQIDPKQSVSFEARFYYGLGNAFPSGRAELFNSTNTMSVSFTAGYWFRMK